MNSELKTDILPSFIFMKNHNSSNQQFNTEFIEKIIQEILVHIDKQESEEPKKSNQETYIL